MCVCVCGGGEEGGGREGEGGCQRTQLTQTISPPPCISEDSEDASRVLRRTLAIIWRKNGRSG